MHSTLSDLDPATARAVCPIIAAEYKRSRDRLEAAVDQLHRSAMRLMNSNCRTGGTIQTRRFEQALRDLYTRTDEIRDQLDQEVL